MSKRFSGYSRNRGFAGQAKYETGSWSEHKREQELIKAREEARLAAKPAEVRPPEEVRELLPIPETEHQSEAI